MIRRRWMPWTVAALLSVVTLTGKTTYGQPLTITGPGLPHLRASAAAWGDYDNDGDLDLALAGLNATGQIVTKIFKNSAGAFTEDPAQQITGVIWGDLAWGDFDNDGRLDLAVSGQGGSGDQAFGVSEVYRNVNGTLTRDPAQLVGPPPFFEVKLLRYSSVAWADFTNDGKLDLLIAGIDRNGFVSTKLYANQNNILTENSSQSVVAIRNGAVSWGDFNGDGVPDLAIMGLNDQGLRTTNVYINQNGLLIESSEITLPAIYGGDLAWGDFNGDGNQDLAISGWDEKWRPVLKIYRNNALRGTLELAFSLDAGSDGIVGSLAWGDYDNDGDLDLAVSGRNQFTDLTTAIYVNNGTSFDQAVEPALEGQMNGTLLWGDVNGDSRLDLLVSGEKDDGSLQTTIYLNGGGGNVAPVAPVLSRPLVTSSGIVFRWQEGSDAETPTSRLTYNLRLGTTSGGNELISASVIGNSASKGAGPGNMGQTLIKRVDFPVSVDSLFWSVQTVDAGFERSAFSTQDTIVIERLVNSRQQLVGVRQTILGQGLAWGDYDADGFIDLAIAGRDINGDAKTLLYRNESGVLTQNTRSTLNGLMNGALIWGDYDNDGDLDLFRSGEDRFNNGFSFLYRNNNGVFRADSIQTYIANLNLRQGGAVWGDYNNDGRLDLVASGLSRTGLRTTRAYRNVPGDTLVLDQNQTIAGAANGQMAMGDVDNDGDLDLILTGETGTPSEFIPVLSIYKNVGGRFILDITQNLTGYFSSAVALGDVDNDGDLDLVVTGGILSGNTAIPQAKVYKNNGSGTFTDAQTLRGTFGGAVALGDVDNDGDLDLMLTGQDVNSALIAVLYRNDSGTFTETSIAVLPGNVFSAVGWADYDNDRDLDLVITGGTGATFVEVSRVFDNLTGQTRPNSAPVAPASLTSLSTGNRAILSWSEGVDSETASAGLTYALRVGTSPGRGDIVSRIFAPGIGPLGHARADTLKNLADSTYYWSIRAVDAGLAISSEAAERQFTIDTTPPRIASLNVDPPIAGIGAVVTVVLNLDEKVGVDNTINPTVSFTPTLGGTAIPFEQLSYSGRIWTGKVTISASTASDTMRIGVSGARDLQGNVMTAVAEGGRFVVDTNIPAVVSTIPTPGQRGVAAATTIRAVFSKDIEASSLNADTFKMRRTDTGAPVTGTLVYDAVNRTAQFAHENLAPETEYEVTVGASVTDVIGNRLSADHRWTFFTATQVSRASGGRLTSDNVNLYIPPNTLGEGAEVSLEEVNVDSLLQVLPRTVASKSAQTLRFVGPAVRLSPEDATLAANKPGTLTLKYAGQPGLSEIDETKLGIYRQTGSATWERVGGTVNTSAKTVITAIDRLGVYGIFEDTGAAGSTVALSAFRAQPRVFSPGGNRFNTSDAAISFNLGQSFPVTIEVYNMAGRLVRTLCSDQTMGPGTMVELWNGKDNQGRLCPSGLYIVIIDAGGNQDRLTLSVLND